MSDTKVLTSDGTQHLIDKIKSEKESTFRYTTMPTASSTNVGQIIQYIGESTQTYTSGYFYKCVAQGTDPETYAWEQTNVQPTSEGMSYEVVTELPTQNIDTETIYTLKPSKNEIISDGNARSITILYGTASGSESYHSSFDIEAGTVIDISVTLSKISVNVPSCRIDVVINGVSTTIANGITTGTTSNISAQYTLNDDFVAARDTFVIVVDHSQWTGDATVNIGKLSILGYVPRKEYDYDYYLNTDGTPNGWEQIALFSDLPQPLTSEQITDIKSQFHPSNTANVNIVPYHIYSPNEHVVGEWQEVRDGVLKKKDIYEKTFMFTLDDSSVENKFDSNLSNVEMVILLEGVSVSVDDKGYRPISFTYPTYDAGYLHYVISVYYDTNTNKFSFYRGSIKTPFKKVKITMRYTKTSDEWQPV